MFYMQALVRFNQTPVLLFNPLTEVSMPEKLCAKKTAEVLQYRDMAFETTREKPVHKVTADVFEP